jgi:hypothetical protein
MPRPKKETISKLEMMREAVAKHGKDAPLADLLKFIKQTYGITLDRALAYTRSRRTAAISCRRSAVWRPLGLPWRRRWSE